MSANLLHMFDYAPFKLHLRLIGEANIACRLRCMLEFSRDGDLRQLCIARVGRL